MRKALVLAAPLLLCACRASVPPPAAPAAPAKPAVLSGIDVLQRNSFRELQGLRIGLITNQTGVDRDGRSTVDILAQAPGVELAALFSPEHGFAGVSESSSVDSGRYALPNKTTIPLFSLYGSTKAPTPEMLAGLDALVFDIQDIGARFYTYATTMALSLEEASKAGKRFVVLDRPNPINGLDAEGPVLDIADGLSSFISYFPVPVRHGLTMGELARLHHAGKPTQAPEIIGLEGWTRRMWFDETGLPWVKPSPNMPTLDSATLYPGIAVFEASNISVGRGTPLPFLWVGAPWINEGALLKRLEAARGLGVGFRAESFTPTKSVFAGTPCRGVAMSILDRSAVRPVRIYAHLLAALRDLHPNEFRVQEERLPRFIGTKAFLELYRRGAGPDELIGALDHGMPEFEAARDSILLYR